MEENKKRFTVYYQRPFVALHKEVPHVASGDTDNYPWDKPWQYYYNFMNPEKTKTVQDVVNETVSHKTGNLVCINDIDLQFGNGFLPSLGSIRYSETGEYIKEILPIGFLYTPLDVVDDRKRGFEEISRFIRASNLNLPFMVTYYTDEQHIKNDPTRHWRVINDHVVNNWPGQNGSGIYARFWGDVTKNRDGYETTEVFSFLITDNLFEKKPGFEDVLYHNYYVWISPEYIAVPTEPDDYLRRYFAVRDKGGG